MRYILLLLLALLFNSCDNKEQNTGVTKMHWDRDMCARCVMVISDRKNAIQVKYNNITYKFDDFGCMAIWSKENKIDLNKNINIYVTDFISGAFIDAKKAFYSSGNSTPMGFGYSAYKLKKDINESKKILSFSEVYAILKK